MVNKNNKMKVCLNITFVGVDGFERYRPLMESVISTVSRASLLKFTFAINEAVCNALRYGHGGLDEAKVQLKIKFNDRFIVAKIGSDSEGFDVEDYVNQLNQSDNWWEALKKEKRGRGLWIMLTGSKKVIYNSNGCEVMLVEKLTTPVNGQEGNLLNKLFVSSNACKEGGGREKNLHNSIQ